MNSQFHTPSLFDDVIFPDISDVAPQLEQQAAAGPLHNAQQSQRIRGMDQSYNDYSNNADPTQYTGHIEQQQQLLHHHPHMNVPHLPVQVVPQQHLDMQLQAGGLQTMAARKQMATPTGSPEPAGGGGGGRKPLSAYAMFFRDTVSTIKQQHPGGTFPELSRIVASMWETLDPERREVYNKRHELACLELFKQEQAMGQPQLNNLMVGGGEATPMNNVQTKPAVFTISRYNNNEMAAGFDGGHFSNGTMEAMQQQQQHPGDCYNVNSLMSDMMPQQHALMQQTPQLELEQPQQQQQQQQQQQVDMLDPTNAAASGMPAGGNLLTGAATTPLAVGPDATAAAAVVVESADSTTNSFEATDSPMTAASTQQMLTEAGSVQKCTRESCTQMAIINPDWEDEYCSNECVVLHCSNVFNGWIKANLEERKRLEAKNC